MPRPRKPTAVLELQGAFKKDPQRGRARANEPRPTGMIGAAPAGFDPELIAIWDELSRDIPPGVLTNADRLMLEITCRLTQKLRNGRIHGGELSVLAGCCTRLGMTPADRSKIAVPKQEKAENRFTKLAQVVSIKK